MIEEIEKVLSFFEQKTDRQRTKEAYRSAVNRFTDFLVENKKTTIAPIEFTQYDALTSILTTEIMQVATQKT